MKLIRFLTTSFFLIFFTALSFGQSQVGEDQLKELLRRAVQDLENTTELIQEVREENIELKIKISSMKEIIADYEAADNSDLVEENKNLKVLLVRARDDLIASNIALEDAKEQIISDQIEIEDLRINLQTCIDSLPIPSMLAIGGGIVYPLGAQLMFTFKIPILPLSVYTNASILFNPIIPYFSIGVTYHF